MDNIKQEHIEDICFNVSQNIILPKFKNLSDDEINYKNGSDLVTAADIEAEKELKKNLLKILPTSNFIGEEEYSRNENRIPNYHRLDVAMTIHGKKVNKKGKNRRNNNSLVISIYNLYNRKNPFSIYFSQGKKIVSETFVPGQVTRLSIIGSFVPSITYRGSHCKV